MKILHINRNYITSALHQVMLGHLDELDIENDVFAPTDHAEFAVITPAPNVIVSECFTKWDRFFFDLKQIKIMRALESICHVEKYDCIHAYTLFTDGNCAMRLSEKYNVPYMVAVRNTDVNDFFQKLPFLRQRGIQIMRKASAVCFLSEAYRSQIFEKYIPNKFKDELRKKTYIISNGINDFWLNNLATERALEHKAIAERRKLKLLYAGRIDKNKNLPTTLNAIEILKKEGWDITFTVVGKVEDEGEYKKITASPFVRYIPAQPKEKLLQIYRGNDIFVMPSFTESFGLVYAEAMSQGLPVVYSQGQGFDGQFREGLVGFHADAHSAESVAMAIRKIIADYETITKHISEYAMQFTWDQIVAQYETLYQRIR